MANLAKISWWQWLPLVGWLSGWRIVVVVESADEVPQRLPYNGAALVGSTDRPKWIVFDCPCQTGHRIMSRPGQKSSNHRMNFPHINAVN